MEQRGGALQRLAEGKWGRALAAREDGEGQGAAEGRGSGQKDTDEGVHRHVANHYAWSCMYKK